MALNHINLSSLLIKYILLCETLLRLPVMMIKNLSTTAILQLNVFFVLFYLKDLPLFFSSCKSNWKPIILFWKWCFPNTFNEIKLTKKTRKLDLVDWNAKQSSWMFCRQQSYRARESFDTVPHSVKTHLRWLYSFEWENCFASVSFSILFVQQENGWKHSHE